MSKGRYVATKTELARRCGISYQRLLSNWQREGRPKEHSPGSSRYEVNLFRDWIASWKSSHRFGIGSEGETYTPNERERALIDRNKISAQRERFKLQVEMAEYVPRIEANRAIEIGNRIVLNELGKSFASELPPRLEGLSSAEIRKVLLAKLRQLTNDIPQEIKKIYANGSNGS